MPPRQVVVGGFRGQGAEWAEDVAEDRFTADLAKDDEFAGIELVTREMCGRQARVPRTFERALPACHHRRSWRRRRAAGSRSRSIITVSKSTKRHVALQAKLLLKLGHQKMDEAATEVLMHALQKSFREYTFHLKSVKAVRDRASGSMLPLSLSLTLCLSFCLFLFLSFSLFFSFSLCLFLSLSLSLSLALSLHEHMYGISPSLSSLCLYLSFSASLY